MNTLVKNSFYSGIGLVASNYYSLTTFATKTETTFGTSNANTTGSKLEDQTLGEAIQTYVNYFMTFLYLIAVLFALWGGFLILTAGGEEDKVKKGKTILIQGAIGLLVIWLAGTIVKWVLSLLASS